MFRFFASIAVLFLCIRADAQSTTSSDSTQTPAQKAKADSIRIAKLEASMIYPFINGGKNSGVVPVNNPSFKPDPNMKYKLLFEITIFNRLRQQKDINHGLTEVCRIINLHVASGIPEKNLEMVVVVHAPGLFSYYKNEYYQKKYNFENPNIELIQNLSKKGITFIGCAQAMAYLNMTANETVPEMKISLTAQTVLSNYLLKGFVLYAIKEDKF